MKVCIIGISGKLGQYMVEHALAAGHEVTGVCRPESVGKLARFGDRITVFPGRTDDPQAVARAADGADGVLVVLAPWGVQDYASGTVRAVLAGAAPDARLVFSCGWHITLDGADRLPWKDRLMVALFGPIARLLRFADLDDQVRATRMVFDSGRRWTVVRGSALEEGESQGLPVWADRCHDPILASNLTRRTDFALFMVRALENDGLIGRAPAITGRQSRSAVAAAVTA